MSSHVRGIAFHAGDQENPLCYHLRKHFVVVIGAVHDIGPARVQKVMEISPVVVSGRGEDKVAGDGRSQFQQHMGLAGTHLLSVLRPLSRGDTPKHGGIQGCQTGKLSQFFGQLPSSLVQQTREDGTQDLKSARTIVGIGQSAAFEGQVPKEVVGLSAKTPDTTDLHHRSHSGKNRVRGQPKRHGKSYL